MFDDARIDVYLICNARYHDTNFARLELLTLLTEHEDKDGPSDRGREIITTQKPE